MAQVTLNYWGGARAAAGTAAEVVEAGSVAEALTLVQQRRDDPRFTRVVEASSLLLDGTAVHTDALGRSLAGPVVVEVLPPFAGG